MTVGFPPPTPTLTNLLVAEELITKWLDDGSVANLIYLDFSKAFDSVSHRLLLDKLRGYGNAPIAINWVECFLSRRTFQVNVNETLSQMPEAISGVPQGSVIGPIIFVINFNNLPDNLSSDNLLYADDVTLIAPVTAMTLSKAPLTSAIWR